MRTDREKGEAIRKEVHPYASQNVGNVEMRNLTSLMRSYQGVVRTAAGLAREIA